MQFDRTLLENDFRGMIGPLCNAAAPSGFEKEAEMIVREMLPKNGYEISSDKLNNLIVHKPGKGPRVAVVAHLDEIGLIVRTIDSHGFLWCETLAGIQPQQLFGKHVIVLTEQGHLDGVINHMKPGRPLSCQQMPVSLDEFFVDIGAADSNEAAEMGVEPGTPVCLDYPTVFMGKDKQTVAAKALDDRACVYQLIELCRLLADETIPADFYAVFSTQEEVGGRGAIVAADNIRPDYVIALDMSLSTDLPGMAERQQVNRQRGGASIKVMDRSRGAACGLISDTSIVRDMKRICRENHIPYQVEAYAAGATDASVMQTKGGGSRCGGIQIPMRYVYSYETAYIPDILDTIDPGQIEAARSLGMTFFQMIRSVVLPQAFRSTVLQMTNLLVATMLTTALASQVPLRPTDLTGIVSYINSRSVGGVTAFLVSAVLYCATAVLIGQVGNLIDRKVRILR